MTTKDLFRANSLFAYLWWRKRLFVLRYGEKKTGSSAHIPKRTGCTPWFFRMSASTKLNCAFNNSLNSKKKYIKK